MWFPIFVWILAIIQSVGMATIIALRCQLDDGIDCTNLYGKSVSWLIDWSWIRTFSAVLLGGCAFLNIWFAFGLLYPCYKNPFKHWYIWMLRLLHAFGFFSVAVVGIFDIKEHNAWHMRAAFWLFIALSLECFLVLFIPENKCNIQNFYRVLFRQEENQEMSKEWTDNYWRITFSIQIVHALLIPTFAILYLLEDYGPYEWIAIWLILFYYTWFSRDHIDEIVHTDLVDHPSKECVYAKFTPMKMESLQVQYKK